MHEVQREACDCRAGLAKRFCTTVDPRASAGCLALYAPFGVSSQCLVAVRVQADLLSTAWSWRSHPQQAQRCRSASHPAGWAAPTHQMPPCAPASCEVEERCLLTRVLKKARLPSSAHDPLKAGQTGFTREGLGLATSPSPEAFAKRH